MPSNINSLPANDEATLTEQIDLDTGIRDNLQRQLAAEVAKSVVDHAAVTTYNRELRNTDARLVKSRKALSKLMGSEESEEDAEAVQTAFEVLEQEARDELKRRDFYYVMSTERFWHRSSGEWTPVSENALRREIPMADAKAGRSVLFEVMKEDQRWYDTCTFTFGKVAANVLNMLERDFVTIEDGDPHWFFDAIVAGIGGEKAENIEHIEKLIISKFLHRCQGLT